MGRAAEAGAKAGEAVMNPTREQMKRHEAEQHEEARRLAKLSGMKLLKRDGVYTLVEPEHAMLTASLVFEICMARIAQRQGEG
jgi:hypothetical protein